MNNKFLLNRFCKYFVYDLKNARNQFMVSLLVICLLPAIVFGLEQIFYLVVKGTWCQEVRGNQVLALLAAVFAIMLSFPSKVYGRITDKRAGTEFLMIPASTLEKWLSMIIVTCVVLPLCFAVPFFGLDALMSIVFPSYGEALIGRASEVTEQISASSMGTMNLKSPFILYLNWCENILIFTLGAICFRRSKTAKTILCYIMFSIFVSIFTMLLIGRTSLSSDDLARFFENEDPESIMRNVKLFVWSFYAIMFSGLLGGCFYRLRTIKQ